MPRFLFVVPPLTGHTNPTLSVAAALQSRGHAVAWVGHPGAIGPLLPPGAQLVALDDRVPRERFEAAAARAATVRGLSGLQFLWEDFLLPLGRAMVEGVQGAVDSLAPDVLVVDQQALAGMVVARRSGRPWASFCTTSASVVDPLATLPKVREWLDAQLVAFQADFGLPPVPDPDLSPHRVVVFSTPALVGPRVFPPHVRFVGPSIAQRIDPTPFPFEALRAGVPRVLVSLGTVNAERGGRFFHEVQAALGGEALQVVLVAPPELAPDPPANFLVRPRVPQLALLPHLDAVLCHAGHNTTCEALAHGLPLVVAPIKDDQPVVAQQVVDAGAGLRVKFGRVRAPALRDAVLTVLREPSFREAAGRIRASFAAAGGARAAATALEELL